MTTITHIDSSIAIIGMAGQFPGAKSIEQFWANIKDGIESIQFFSQDDHLSIVPFGKPRQYCSEIPCSSEDYTCFRQQYF